ncbi:hypothetical protein WMY93_032020 [Mugilogobius chulae]|uniref:C-type lectin domain-containing protein n=1 Tax=Mugilogobius chulae TaxID=88201 RepID=A0AAW0MF60_9GOBI
MFSVFADEDAHVLTIRDKEENEFIRQQLEPFRNLVQFVWLGMFKDENDNQTKWFDGTNVQYNNWKYGRMSVDKPFMAGLNTYGVWFYIINKLYFQDLKQKMIVACKVEKDDKKQYNTSVVDFQQYGSLSYQVLPQKLTWFKALEECGRRGGHLASIHDLQHDAHINLITKTDGLNCGLDCPAKMDFFSTFQTGTPKQKHAASGYEWSDGTALKYKPNIFELSSSPGPSEASCVYVTTEGKWVRSSCQTVTEGAICYTTNITTASQRAKLQTAPASNRCPQKDGGSLWVQHEEHCYAFDTSFYNYSVYNMEQAKSFCDNLDAEVLTVKTKEENDFVSKHLADDPLVTSKAWLGISVNSEGKPLSWIDTSALEYSNWKTGALSSVSGQKQCAVLNAAAGGTWELVQCNTISRVVCQTKARKSSPAALVILIILLVLLLLAAAFIVYKKKRAHFSTTVRYKRTYDQTDSTSIVTDPE